MSEKGRRKGHREERATGVGGFLDGLSNLLGKLEELAEKGGELRKTGEFGGGESDLRGVYGFNIKVGLGEGVKVEPFGNVHKDERTGEAVVSEISEPLVDVFEEEEYVLVVAEMPGVAEEDVDLALKDDILTIAGERGQKKYRKEILLPQSFASEQMSCTCRNGILKVKLNKGSEKGQEK
jgi:HSP20 family protein